MVRGRRPTPRVAVLLCALAVGGLAAAGALALPSGSAAQCVPVVSPCPTMTTTTTTGTQPAPPPGFQPAAPSPGGGGSGGGTLQVLQHEDFQHLDPGQAYFTLDYPVAYATQRPLYSFAPGTTTQLTPDLADSPPTISADGRTVTVHIRSGVRFSPPVNREVTSADVAYAIERGANPNVGNGYFAPYFGALVGALKASGGPIPGITTPDAHTIVFHLDRPAASFFARALSLPLTAPVPPEFARPLDAQRPTAYGNYLVATGPYMVQSDGRGNVIGVGYHPGRAAVLVRNPNWSPATDYRPAHLDEVDIAIGGGAAAIGSAVLSGSHVVQGDPPVPSAAATAQRTGQLSVTPGGSVLYVALDNHRGPFANRQVRRALWAALNRNAMVAASGPAGGHLATHFIYPGITGFQEAGGAAGPRVPYARHAGGDLPLARSYLRRAGFRGGRYTGGHRVLVVGATGSPNTAYAEIVNRALRALGFRARLLLVDQPVMYGKYCGVPAREVDVCPDVGWIGDFGDPQTVLDVPFNGRAITPTNNSNWGQVNDPQINRAMAAAELVQGAGRPAAWARVDRLLVAKAVAVPFLFGTGLAIEARDVAGVADVWNQGGWDYDFTALR